MTWENAIYIKLNLGDISRQIISDRTGLLFSAEFIDFLRSTGTSFLHCEDLSDLRQQVESGKIKTIITTLKEIPYYLSGKADIKKFTLADLQFITDVEAMNSMKLDQQIMLLNYLNATNLTQSPIKGNIQSLLQNAKRLHTKILARRIENEIETIIQHEVDYENIIKLGRLFGELEFLSFDHPDIIDKDHLTALRLQMDEYSYNYILSGNLKNIFYEPSSNVRSVSNILPYVKSVHKDKTALICFDCMGMAEWYLLKDYLQPLDLDYNERNSFSLIPSITSISRAAIFYGSNTEVFSLPYVNEAKALQTQFPGVNCRLFREKDTLTPDSLLGLDIVSIIYNFFDDLSHSAKFPTNFENKSLYFDSVRNFLDSSSIIDQIRLLSEEGFQLFFCSDHGSVIAKGNGKKIDKYLQDKFAKRACLIEDTTLVDLLDFPKMRIPFVEGKTLVLPRGRSMFDHVNSVEISHGGIAVEEIVVPFIEVVK